MFSFSFSFALSELITVNLMYGYDHNVVRVSVHYLLQADVSSADPEAIEEMLRLERIRTERFVKSDVKHITDTHVRSMWIARQS